MIAFQVNPLTKGSVGKAVWARCLAPKSFRRSGFTNAPLSNSFFGVFASSQVPVPTDGKFHHMAEVFDGTDVTSYLDGEPVGGVGAPDLLSVRQTSVATTMGAASPAERRSTRW